MIPLEVALAWMLVSGLLVGTVAYQVGLRDGRRH